MQDVVLILKSIYQGEVIRLNASSIESYIKQAHYTTIRTKSADTIQVLNQVEDIDLALRETYCTVREVLLSSPKVNNNGPVIEDEKKY